MSEPDTLYTQGELESLSETIASGLEPEQILALIAQRTCQVLTVQQAQIFLKQGQKLVNKASYSLDGMLLPLPKLASGEEVESWVVRHGRPIVLEQVRPDWHTPSDFTTTERHMSSGDQEPFSIAAVPIWSGRQSVGALAVIDTTPTSTPPEVPGGAKEQTVSGRTTISIKGLLPLLSVLADLTSLAIENSRILAREERRSRLISLLQYMASTSSEGIFKEITQALEARISEVMNAQKVEVLLYNQETDELVSLQTSETPLGRAQHELGLDHLPLGKAGVLADVFRTGQPFFSNNLDTIPGFPAALKEQLGLKAAIVVALEVEGKRRGLLGVLSASSDAFQEDDLAFLNLISIRLGYMLHHQELSAELAQAETERLARAERENFLLVVAHDLKNALTTIRGNAQLALRRATKGDSTATEQAFKLIAVRASQAIQLVNDMVDVNQMETGLFRLYIESVELVELLREEIAAVQETTSKACPILFRSDFDHVYVKADAGRLSQVLTNLLINAIHYSPQGGQIEVHLTHAPQKPVTSPQAAAQHPQFPQAVMVIVNDQGIGVLPSEREHIFERAYRGRGSRLAPGSGLGLYISKEIIERHGGRLWVQPREGQGSSFCFTLPSSRSSEAGGTQHEIGG